MVVAIALNGNVEKFCWHKQLYVKGKKYSRILMMISCFDTWEIAMSCPNAWTDSMIQLRLCLFTFCTVNSNSLDKRIVNRLAVNSMWVNQFNYIPRQFLEYLWLKEKDLSFYNANLKVGRVSYKKKYKNSK